MTVRTMRGTALDGLLGVAFLALLIRVATQSGPLALDSWVTGALPPLHGSGMNPILTWPAELITDLGQPVVWTVGALLIAGAVAGVQRSWLPVRIVAPPVVVEAVVVLTLKAALGRIGPPGATLPHPFGYFPSGHTATAFVCTGALAAVIARQHPGRAPALRIGVVAWTVLIATALVYCRYHWLTDVVGSLLLGLLVLRLCCRPLWTPARLRDDPPAQDDALRVREDA
jgi:membrane-associated phospholipid phosphatase